jgi:hypothetical protein
MNSRATLAGVVVAAVAIVATAHGAASISRQQADAFSRKITLIRQHGETASPKAGTKPVTRRTPVTESELNSWFAYHSQPLLPEGLTRPTLTIIGNGRVAGEATVDLDAIGKRRQSGGAFDPWNFVGGRLRVTVSGLLHTRDGRGRFELQSAEVSGIPVPKTLLQELVSHYSKSADDPDGVRLDDAFELPANIRQIEVGAGQAVVVQ